MIRFLIYIYVAYLLLKKLFNVVMNYKEYYSINKLKLNLLKADTYSKRKQGLKNRKKKLLYNEGLLLTYKVPRIINLSMKETKIPLDILFLNKEYRVIDYIKNAKGYSKKSYKSKIKCSNALELNKGSIKKLNIKSNTIIIPRFISKLK